MGVLEAMERYEGRAPVDVEADLTLTVEGKPITVESYTDLVRVDLPSLRAGLAIARMEGALDRTGHVDAVLRTLDLTVDVSVDGVRIARLGADADPPLARLPLEPDYHGALRALVAAPIRFFN